MPKRKTKKQGRSCWDCCRGRGGYVFLGFFFLGLGAGMFYGEAGAGAVIGLGLGFLASFIFGRK